MKKSTLIIFGLLLAPLSNAQDWIKVEVDELSFGKYQGVKISDTTNEHSLTVYRKPISTPGFGPKKTDKVVIKLQTNSLDLINRSQMIIFKATKGKVFALDSDSRGLATTATILSFHGSSSTKCGIIGNMLLSDNLTVRYHSSGNKTIDVKFDIPKTHSDLFEVMKLDSSKDCTEVSE